MQDKDSLETANLQSISTLDKSGASPYLNAEKPN